MEGPRENAEAARALVMKHMGNPWAGAMENPPERPLRVELSTDCKYADTWYEAK